MRGVDTCRVRPMVEDDIDRVLAWRNDEATRRNMLTQHIISRDEHLDWFARSSIDASRRLLIVEERDLALGFVQFADVADGGIANWGFYTAPGAAKGSGKKLGRTALEFGFTVLRLHKVCGQALQFNDASIGFHLHLGFRQEGVLREQYRIGHSYHNLLCFGLLQRDWAMERAASNR